MKKTFWSILLVVAILMGCGDADVVSDNLSKATSMFEVNRRIVIYNELNGEYLIVIEGLCNKGDLDHERKASITCKVGPNEYRKHLLYLSDNVTYFMEQLDPVKASSYQYRVIFKPPSIAPNTGVRE